MRAEKATMAMMVAKRPPSVCRQILSPRKTCFTVLLAASTLQTPSPLSSVKLRAHFWGEKTSFFLFCIVMIFLFACLFVCKSNQQFIST